MSAQVPDPPFKRATSQQKARRSERAGAKADGGRTTPMSGAGKKKGDYHAKGYLVEDKFTDQSSFRVETGTLAKTEAQALQAGMLPMWRVTLPGFKLRILREDDYLYLEERASRADD